MQGHVVPQTTLNAVAAVRIRTPVRANNITREEREAIADFDKKFPTRAAAMEAFHREFPTRSIAPDTFKRLLEAPEVSPIRGRPRLMSEPVAETMRQQMSAIRGTGEAISLTDAAAIGQGLLLSKTPHMQELGIKFSRATTHRQLVRLGIRKRAATTNRCVSAREVKAGGVEFYRQLAATGVRHKQLVFNMDEFFVKLGSGAKTTYTEEQACAIGVKEIKAGFTSSILTSCDGGVHLLQMIWIGTTARCHAPIQHAILLQQHRDKSHFQNTTTYREWFEKFVEVVNKVRADNGFDATEPALLIVDEAPQHAEFQDLEEAHHIVRVSVPKKQTHIFQPADQFVIANIRKGLNEKASDYLRQAAARNALTPEKMAAEVQRGTAEWRRKQAGFLLEVATGFMAPTVVKSWTMTGIPRAIFGTVPDCPVLYDAYAVMEDDAVIAPSEDDVSDDEGQADGDVEQQGEGGDAEQGEREVEEVPVAEPPAGHRRLRNGAPAELDYLVVGRLGRPPKEPTHQPIKQAFLTALRDEREKQQMNARWWAKRRGLSAID
jgi:hypothetical protein